MIAIKLWKSRSNAMKPYHPNKTKIYSMVKPIRPSPSEQLFWWQVWKIFIPSLHTVTNVTVWRLGMKNSYLSPSGNFIPKWWQIWILFIWWHTIWWHIHIDMKMNIFFRWWHVQTVTSMILIGEWYFFSDGDMFRRWQSEIFRPFTSHRMKFVCRVDKW